MGRVSKETIEKLNEFICSLPEEARGKCALCNQTLVHIVKQAEAQTGAGTATVTKALADKINETAAPLDRVEASSLRDKVIYTEQVEKPISGIFTNRIEDLEKENEAEIVREAKKINAEKFKQKREENLKDYNKRVETKSVRPEPTTRPNLILSDPPWKYDFSETASREIENHYNTEEVSGMETHIPETQDDCILFMWATAPKLKEAFELMASWGFEYKTCAVWDKEIIGMGYWFRGQHELLMVGVKGNVSPPLQDFRVSSVFKEKRTKHSKKPECVYEWIEKAFGDKDKLEMYCRTTRDGWAAMGNEI